MKVESFRAAKRLGGSKRGSATVSSCRNEPQRPDVSGLSAQADADISGGQVANGPPVAVNGEKVDGNWIRRWSDLPDDRIEWASGERGDQPSRRGTNPYAAGHRSGRSPRSWRIWILQQEDGDQAEPRRHAKPHSGHGAVASHMNQIGTNRRRESAK